MLLPLLLAWLNQWQSEMNDCLFCLANEMKLMYILMYIHTISEWHSLLDVAGRLRKQVKDEEPWSLVLKLRLFFLKFNYLLYIYIYIYIYMDGIIIVVVVIVPMNICSWYCEGKFSEINLRIKHWLIFNFISTTSSTSCTWNWFFCYTSPFFRIVCLIKLLMRKRRMEIRKKKYKKVTWGGKRGTFVFIF